MASYSLIVRFPSGTEYWYAAKVPELGELIASGGMQYVVTECETLEDDRVVVTLAEQVAAVEPLPAT